MHKKVNRLWEITDHLRSFLKVVPFIHKHVKTRRFIPLSVLAKRNDGYFRLSINPDEEEIVHDLRSGCKTQRTHLGRTTTASNLPTGDTTEQKRERPGLTGADHALRRGNGIFLFRQESSDPFHLGFII